MGKPDKEEVINHLHIIHAFANMAYEDLHEQMFKYMSDWTKDAIDLIENEDKGVEPIRVDQWNSVCGVCGEPVEYPYGGADDWLIAHFDFCQRCGRRVKWDE